MTIPFIKVAYGIVSNYMFKVNVTIKVGSQVIRAQFNKQKHIQVKKLHEKTRKEKIIFKTRLQFPDSLRDC